MDVSGPQLAKEVAALAEALRSVEMRVLALEGGAAPKMPPPEPVPVSAPVPAMTSYAALAGKCLFVLAGAFLVRALTDAGTLPRGAGVALGLAYAMTWLVVADRSGRAGSAGATAWGVTALVIACPLVWEASTRFEVLPPSGAAAVLLAVAAVALAACVRRNLDALAWFSVLSTLVVAIVLTVSTHALVVFAAFFAALTAAAWAASLRAGGPGLPWAPAVVADLVVLEVVWIASRPEGPPEAYRGLSPAAVFSLALALFAAPLAGKVWRALSGAGSPGAFEAVQTGAALVLLVLAFSRLVPLGVISPSLVWALAGFAAAAAPARLVGSFAPAYGAVLLVGAAFVSGLAAFAFHAFFGPPVAARPSPDSLFVLFVSAAATLILMRRVRAEAPVRALDPGRGAMLALACVSIVGSGALAEWGLATLLAPNGDPARTAAVRSAVLAASSVLLAACGRLTVLSGLARLAWPVLGLAALKLVFEDLPRGHPSTLVATFVLYGAALILVPRLSRGAGREKTPEKG